MLAQSAAPALSVRDLRTRALGVLKAAGIDNAEREADWLLAPALSALAPTLNPQALLLEGSRLVPPQLAERAWSSIRRRAAREPLQYILGSQEFRGLEIHVTQDVLIPRPESELLVDETIRSVAKCPAPVIADVGTGSGCLAVAIARERPGARIYATDISAAALVVARGNAERHGVARRIDFIQGDLLTAFLPTDRGMFDAIVANPPYIAEPELGALPPEVSRYEPAQALAAGPDGLMFYRRLFEEAPPRLRREGWLILELGFGQAPAVKALAGSAKGMSIVTCRPDAAGIERVLIARRVS